MKDTIRLGIAAVTSPLEVGADEAPGLQEGLTRAFVGLKDPRLELFPAPAPVADPNSAVAAGRRFYDERVDAICLVAASWYEDYSVLDMLEECNVPVIAWARPGMETGSLCGMQQLGYVLKEIGHPYTLVFDQIGSERVLHRALNYASAASLRGQLRRARIGYLGHRVEGMTDTTVNELALKKVFGPRVVSIDSKVFLDRAARVAPESAQGMWKDLTETVGQVTATEGSGIESLQVSIALREMIEEMGLSAVAAGCYPHLMGKVCLAASLLGEEGIPVACEGDVNGALGMLMLTRLTGQAVHDGDLLDPIPEDNAIVYSHCGSGGFSLASSLSQVTLGPVRLMHRGVCVLFPARPGPVTLVHICASMRGYRMALCYGEALETDMVFPGNPLRVQFRSDYRDVLAWIAAEGLGHHWMVTYGDLRDPLRDLADLVGCELLEME